jgi:ATP phosphoribosyltransferase
VSEPVFDWTKLVPPRGGPGGVGSDLVRIAIPARGRLRAPTIALLAEAGLDPDEPSERALAFLCRNAPIEVLLVRGADIPAYVEAGAVDCGITGADLVRESERDLAELLRLGYGACRLEAAVPEGSPAQSLRDLDGIRVATAHPKLAAKMLDEAGVSATIVPVEGSVEVAPRVGVADAIIDLAATGETIRRNGLRSVGGLLVSEAVVVARRPPSTASETLAFLLAGVVHARSSRGVVVQVPDESVPEACTLLSGAVAASRGDGTTVVKGGVRARQLWDVVSRLMEVGALELTLLPFDASLSRETVMSIGE